MAARSQFARLLAMGVTLNFFFYIMINAAMVMGLIPVVGIPMPLISYGGTAMLTVTEDTTVAAPGAGPERTRAAAAGSARPSR